MEAADWEFTGRPPDARLDGLVLRYAGYAISSAQQLRRRELPTTTLPLVISFGDPFVLDGEPIAAFTGGLQESSVLTGWPTRVRGVQVDLSVLGARLLLDVPMSALTGRIVALADVLGPLADRLTERLQELPDWSSRFALLDEVFLARLAAARSPGPALTWAWRCIRDSGGNLDITRLAAELAYSRQHLSTRFRHAFGVAPKTFTRLRRFERAADLVEDGRLPLAEVAMRTGYSDQAHFNREFRRLAGSSPQQHLRLRRSEPTDDEWP
ncbi:MAG: helix-turn-helix transcriptional regulator [Saccharopolyspora sp.]|uniref:helix-turn-helix transcriptional regulator n=1 Tax=Saccharopolyspora sp. TaxID=33915 RepID=UPI0025E4F83E|nr:AraC family transcriptional regulator [Saccharopolyspora sp.]MBQ6639649.1 helix-turn-helix transcriptional regulator [Saccharopolyspora sp.]